MALPYTTSAWSTHALAAAPTPEFPWPDDDYAQTITRVYEGPRSNYARRLNQRTSYTNLLLRSNTIDSASWTEADATATNAVLANPGDGTVTAGTLMETATVATHSVSQAVSLADTTHCFSVFLKANGRTTSTLVIARPGAFASVSAFFDFSTGTGAFGVGIGDTGTAGIIDCGGGWFRCWLTTNHGDSTSNVQIYTSSSGASLGDITKGLYVFAPQLEVGSTPGPLIITPSTSSVTVSVPDVDAIANPTAQQPDPFAFLSSESGLAPVGGATFRYSRTYARLPAEQYDPLSKYFSRPSLDDVTNGSYYGVSFDGGITSHLFALADHVAISAIAAITATTRTRTGTITRTGTNPTAVGSRSPGQLPSFSATVDGPTVGTSNFVNTSTAAAIRTAFTSQGLTDVNATKTDYAITVSWSGECSVNFTGNALVEGGGNSLTIRAPEVSDTTTDTETIAESETQNISESLSVDDSVRQFTTTSAHSAAVGDRVAFYLEDRVIARAIVTTTPSSTSFTVPLDAVDGKDFKADTCVFSSAAEVRLVNGGKDCTARRRHRFYLPGYTSGITTRDDVPNFDTVTDPIAWLGVIAAYHVSPSAATYAVIETEELVRYQGGPILDKAVIEVQVADAYQTRAV